MLELTYSEVVGDGGCRVFSIVSFAESGMRVAETATTMIARCLRSPVSAFQVREMKGTVMAHGPHTYNECIAVMSCGLRAASLESFQSRFDDRGQSSRNLLS